MPLLNGIPPIFGFAMLHVVIINFIAIAVEFWIIKRWYKVRRLLLKVLTANLVSVLVGVYVMLVYPDFIVEQFIDPLEYRQTHSLRELEALRMLAGIGLLFVANLMIEFPVYLLGKGREQKAIKVFLVVLLANVVTNLPIAAWYCVGVPRATEQHVYPHG